MLSDVIHCNSYLVQPNKKDVIQPGSNISSSQNISLSGTSPPQINQHNSGSANMFINPGDLNLLLYPEINYEIHPFARSLHLAKSEKVMEKMRV